MQPYFLPYIGYWQLMNAVDEYVIYDDVNYIKGGWINRNRLLSNGSPLRFSVPLINAGSFRKINEIEIADRPISFLKTIDQNYSKAQQFSKVYPLIEDVWTHQFSRLSDFLVYSIISVASYLGIKPKFRLSSELMKDEDLHGQDMILHICNILSATEYYNAIGGKALYDYTTFLKSSVKLSFLRTLDIEYRQFNNQFVSNLSILDVMMFNTVDKIRFFLSKYFLE
jgi:hypothetical protein